MKKNSVIHIGRSGKGGINEGGLARDVALSTFLHDKSHFVDVSGNRFINVFKVFSVLCFAKEKIVIMQYPLLGVPVSNKFKLLSFIRFALIKLLIWSSGRNNMVFDVSDLPIEQAIDLELPIPHYFSSIEDTVFSLRNTRWSFASESMMKFIIKKYSLSSECCYVCYNGGNSVEQTSNLPIFESKAIKFVYAGTLNKGRQIEEMLSKFFESTHVLVLLGSGGEWLNTISLPQNIIYLGCFPESEAHSIVSSCDIGLVPYAEDRAYYNIAFPTKLSFYLTAGIPFLSTTVTEVLNILDRYGGIGFCSSITNWGDLINNMTRADLDEMKLLIATIKSEFFWNHIFSRVYTKEFLNYVSC